MFRILRDIFDSILNAGLEEVAPISTGVPVSSAASAMAKEGHRQRRETYEQRKAKTHAELRAYLAARKAARA